MLKGGSVKQHRCSVLGLDSESNQGNASEDHARKGQAAGTSRRRSANWLRNRHSFLRRMRHEGCHRPSLTTHQLAPLRGLLLRRQHHRPRLPPHQAPPLRGPGRRRGGGLRHGHRGLGPGRSGGGRRRCLRLPAHELAPLRGAVGHGVRQGPRRLGLGGVVSPGLPPHHRHRGRRVRRGLPPSEVKQAAGNENRRQGAQGKVPEHAGGRGEDELGREVHGDFLCKR
mmetsp:Transcript_53333/g.155405  ORF Transcript_53333/g.155405 Transcript_53333/m.155405 type:complete len:226 (-) Transcript_53333:36-713(-)